MHYNFHLSWWAMLKYCVLSFLVIYTIFNVYPSYSAPFDGITHHNDINAFYLEREGKPLWVKGRKINKRGKTLLRVLEESWHHGFNPQSYHVSMIKQVAKRRFSDAEAMQVELALTDGYVKYFRDLSGMRVSARALALNPKHWRRRINAVEALSFLHDNHKNIDTFIRAQEPQGQTYQMLKDELVRLVQNELRAPQNQDELFVYKGLMKPGYGYDDVPKLRHRFGLVEDKPEDRYTYDPVLVAAVKDFQKQKGLRPDGVVGRQTVHALNHGVWDKILQISLNLERLRWVPDHDADRFIMVNIPSATLWAIENGKVAFEMPVVVGRKKRATPSFITTIHGVRFNPTWTVPPTIKEEDILPELRKDPMYLSHKGMELYDGYGRNSPTIDPSVVDWDNVGENELHGFRMVQVSGARNPLGRIRVLMPNPDNIYLHDTNNKSLFSRVNRAKSSGCVRMQDPEKVALFALGKKRGWNNARMQGVLDSRKTRDIYTNERMPVYLLYYTAWVGSQGQVVYGVDIYDRDQPLRREIQKLDSFLKLSDYTIYAQ